MALQLLGAQCATVQCQVLGASPTATAFQYVEAVLSAIGVCATIEVGSLAFTGKFGHRIREARLAAAVWCAGLVVLCVFWDFT